jgi:TolB-like protein/Tfp pilus assembly protein PilF
MKRCPKCGRDYFDDSMLYCLEDGSALVARSDSADMPTVVDPKIWAAASQESIPAFPGASISGWAGPAADNSIAVLPFLNMSADPENEYFCDGLAEELLNVLSKIRGLRVAARTSAFSFKGKSKTIAEIGQVLNVASVLEGSIRIVGNRIRISIQLIKVSDGYHFWSESYDRQMDDIFAVQDEIAQAVVEELRTRLLGEEPEYGASRAIRVEVAAAAKGRATDAEAQRLMFWARAFLDRLTPEDTAIAIDYLKLALDIDPNYARCWAELARAYSVEAGRAWIPIHEGFEKSREAVKRALEIEPDLSEAYAQLGRIQMTYDFDIGGAEASYRRALELAPGSLFAMDGASLLAYKLGRTDEAINLSKRALLQDPLSAAYWHNLGLWRHAAGRLAESEEAFGRAIKLVPQRFVSHALLAMVKMDQRKPAEAVEEAMKEPYEMWRLWALAIVYHIAGNRTGSDECLRTLIEAHPAGNSYQIAQVHAMRGEADEAFQWLGRAYEERDSGVTHAMVDPQLRPLHDDSRWRPFLKKVGFKPEKG